jgi:hypothetical protein
MGALRLSIRVKDILALPRPVHIGQANVRLALSDVQPFLLSRILLLKSKSLPKLSYAVGHAGLGYIISAVALSLGPMTSNSPFCHWPISPV